MGKTLVQQFFLNEVKKEWDSLLEIWDSRPWGLWIREYANATENWDGFSANDIPIKVWFLDEKGIRPKDVNEFQRFVVYQSGSTWSDLVFNPLGNPLWAEGNRVFHEIGLSSFAKIQGSSNKYYFDYIWGSRFGRGSSVAFEQNNDEPIWKNIWVS